MVDHRATGPTAGRFSRTVSAADATRIRRLRGSSTRELWSRVWQIAARLDEIPEPGDYTTYDIGEESVVIVRVDAGTIKAFYNACPHRGTALTPGGCGHFADGKIICPFHGWRWDISRKQRVRARAPVNFEAASLPRTMSHCARCQLVVFAGFVFINFDPNPESFEDFIAPVRGLLENLAIGEMHHYWWKSIPVPANWKVAQEAFFEGYHVPATHSAARDGSGRSHLSTAGPSPRSTTRIATSATMPIRTVTAVSRERRLR